MTAVLDQSGNVPISSTPASPTSLRPNLPLDQRYRILPPPRASRKSLVERHQMGPHRLRESHQVRVGDGFLTVEARAKHTAPIRAATVGGAVEKGDHDLSLSNAMH